MAPPLDVGRTLAEDGDDRFDGARRGAKEQRRRAVERAQLAATDGTTFNRDGQDEQDSNVSSRFGRSDPVHPVYPCFSAGLALASLWMCAGCSPRGAEELTGLVERGPFEITHVVENGELAALRTLTITSRVHTDIESLVKDFARVKKGDVLVELDKTELKDEIRRRKGEFVLAEKRLTEALRTREIRRAQIEIDIEKKDAALRLAEVRLQTLRAGAKPEDISVAEMDLEAAEAALKFAESERDDAETLFKKGFATRSELDEKHLSRELAVARYEKARMRLDRLRAWPTAHELRPAELAREEARTELQIVRERKRSSEAELRQSVAVARAAVSSLKVHIGRHEEDLSHCTIRAPRDGLVLRCTRHWERGKVDVGSHVNVGSGIVEFPDLSAMKVKVHIPETLVRHFSVGDAVEVEVDRIPGEKYGGRIAWIDTWARDKNAELAEADMRREGLSGLRVFRADVELDGTDKRMRLGSKARVLLRRVLPDAVQVDRRAILRRGGKPFARVVRDDGRVELVPVALGDANETAYVVKRGLEPGTRVAFVDRL